MYYVLRSRYVWQGVNFQNQWFYEPGVGIPAEPTQTTSTSLYDAWMWSIWGKSGIAVNPVGTRMRSLLPDGGVLAEVVILPINDLIQPVYASPFSYSPNDAGAISDVTQWLPTFTQLKINFNLEPIPFTLGAWLPTAQPETSHIKFGPIPEGYVTNGNELTAEALVAYQSFASIAATNMTDTTEVGLWYPVRATHRYKRVLPKPAPPLYNTWSYSRGVQSASPETVVTSIKSRQRRG